MLDSMNQTMKVIEHLDSFPAGDACDASDSVPEDLAVGLELPQKVESPNMKSCLVDVGERDMMGDLGPVRKENGERIEKAKEERVEKAKEERIEKAKKERIEKAKEERIEKAMEERIEKEKEERMEVAKILAEMSIKGAVHFKTPF